MSLLHPPSLILMPRGHAPPPPFAALRAQPLQHLNIKEGGSKGDEVGLYAFERKGDKVGLYVFEGAALVLSSSCTVPLHIIYYIIYYTVYYIIDCILCSVPFYIL